jgi:shikimate kinase
MKENVTLIGMPGSGKSSVGLALAQKLGWSFVDTDTLILQKHGKLQDILNTQGPAAFRVLEQEAILSLKGQTRTVISPGGSVVYSPASMAHLKEASTVIFLNVPLAVIQERCEAQSRGIVGLKEKGWDVLYQERNELYKKYADLELVPRGGPPEADAAQILELLDKR